LRDSGCVFIFPIPIAIVDVGVSVV
jgi:hypothetical protein